MQRERDSAYEFTSTATHFQLITRYQKIAGDYGKLVIAVRFP